MYFINYDAPEFERFGGIYVPYNTQQEAERQVANDLLWTNNDPEAAGVLSVFEADYGGHRRQQIEVDDKKSPLFSSHLPVYDYNDPFGHLDPSKRKPVHTPAALVKLAPKLQDDILQEAIRGKAKHDEDIAEYIRTGKLPKNSQPGSAWTIMSGGTSTGGAIGLVAATAKTVLMIIAGSADQPLITEYGISFDGVTATAVPVLCEAVTSTQAGAGTTTSQTPKQLRGWPTQTPQTTGNYNYSAEPTVLEVYKKVLLTPNGGTLVIQNPMGREPTGLVTASTQGKGLGLRLTAPAVVNCHVYVEFEE